MAGNGLRNRYTSGYTKRSAPKRGWAAATDRAARLRNGCGMRAAIHPRAASMNDNVKEQIIRGRIELGSQHAVSRETAP
jgi:hypothetical protein